MLNKFKSMRAHMAIVRDVFQSGALDPVYHTLGIITMEDIIEQILGDEIEDETDEAGGESSKKNKLSSRDIYFARLHLLNPKLEPGEGLSDVEMDAISAHLMSNVEVFKRSFGSKKKVLQRFLAKNASVLTLEGVDRPAESDMLYRKGRVSSTCTLILNGKVTVVSGKDGFSSEIGTWNVIGSDAVESPEGKFIPDFSCHPTSDTVRLLRITISAEAVASALLVPEEEGGGRRKKRAKGGSKKKSSKAVASHSIDSTARGAAGIEEQSALLEDLL